MGFDLSIGKISKILKGKVRRSLEPEYKLLEFWRDGNLIFIGSGGMDYLAWGQYRNEQEPLRINDYALIETIYLFCDLGQRIFSTVAPLPESFIARVELRNMSNGGQPCSILSTQRIPYRIILAPGDGEDFEFQMGPEFFAPGIAAFQFTSKIYEWFGVGYDQIPLTGKANGKFCIDRDKILALSRQ